MDKVEAPRYEYRLDAEAWWFLLVAVGPVFFQAMLEFEPETITDWRVWGTSLMAACVRALGGALLAWLTKRRLEHRDGMPP